MIILTILYKYNDNDNDNDIDNDSKQDDCYKSKLKL